MTAFEIINSDYSNSLSLLLSYGWALKSETEKEIRLTRPCKNIRDGLSGILNKQTGIFTNFSSSVDLPVKSNTIGYNFYELLRHYQFHGDTQATNQFIFDKYKNNNIDLPKRNFHHVLKQVQRKEPPRPIQFYTKEFYFKFADYEYEERAAIFQYDAHKTRHEAEQLVLKENPNAKRERVYRIAINKFVFNKNMNEQGEPLPNFYNLTNRFQNNFLTIDELGQAVCKGYAQVYCNMIEDAEGNIKRTSNSFVNADLIGIDIDEGISIEEFLSKPRPGAVALYTSYNHSKENQRFRVIYELPFVVFKGTDYVEIANSYISELRADQQCKDPARAFFGATNTMFFNLTNGNIQYGKDFKEWT